MYFSSAKGFFYFDSDEGDSFQVYSLRRRSAIEEYAQ